MKNNEGVMVIKSSKNLGYVFERALIILLFLASIFFVIAGEYDEIYQDYKSELATYEEAVEKVRAKLKIHGVSDISERRMESELYLRGVSKPNFFSMKDADDLLILTTVALVLLFSYIYFYWCLLCSTKDFIEIDGKTGACKIVHHRPLGRYTVLREKFDYLCCSQVSGNIYDKKYNTGRLVVRGYYVIEKEVFTEEWELRKCESIELALSDIDRFNEICKIAEDSKINF